MRITFASTCAILIPVCYAAAACKPTSSNGSPIGAVESLPSPTGPGSGEPNLFAASDGRVYLSWIEPSADSGHALRFAVLEDSSWSSARTIAGGGDFFVNWADFPSVVALPNGHLAAHWLRKSETGKYAYDVVIAKSIDGGETWSAPVTPHRDSTESEHGFVSLFPAHGDSLGAVWLDGRKYAAVGQGARKEMMLGHTTIAPDGSFGSERMLDERICDCCQTSVAMTSKGLVVAYRDRSPEEIRDIGVMRLLEGSWTPPRLVHHDNWRIDFCPVNGPAISARDERVAVAWFTAARDSASAAKDTARVLLAFSADGGETFAAPIRVDGGQPQGRVDVELLEDGSAVVSWIERVGGENAEVRVRHSTSRGSLGDPVIVAASSAERASGFPRMVQSGDRVIFAWTVPGRPSSVRVARATLARGRGER